VVNLADSALHAPQATYGGTELYPDFLSKAAVLCSRLARNHPLPDGNKRCAFLSLVEFLERNGYLSVPVESEDPDEIVASQIEALAAGSLDEGDFGRWLADWVRREDP
jgi:death-on-curing protein